MKNKMKQKEENYYDLILESNIVNIVLNKGTFIKITSPKDTYVADSYMSDEIMELFREDGLFLERKYDLYNVYLKL